MPGKPIMVQGTGSYVGKSITVTALCRIFARRGYRTAPFKAQNMALNSYVTFDGGEIGRSTAERALTRATLINKFRGDPTLLGDGLRQLQELTGIPVLGVIPDLGDLGIGEEDTVPTSRFGNWSHDDGVVRIGVIHYPYRSNFTDFDPFFHEPSVEVRYVTDAAMLERCHVMFLPGTKQTMADLQWLRTHGFERALCQGVEAGAFLV